LTDCTACSAVDKCGTCGAGKYPDGAGACVNCVDKADGKTLTCNPTTGFAETCAEKYFPDATTGNCLACAQSDCDLCTSATVCTKCDPGFRLLTADAVVSCTACSTDVNCGTCNATACTACKSGFYDIAACKACSTLNSDCLTCTDVNTCSTCTVGTYADGAKCYNCKNLDKNCGKCSNSTFCTECSGGFYAHTDGKCVACVEGCTSCTSALDCISTACKIGTYYKAGAEGEANTCVACSSLNTDCLTCTAADACTTCIAGKSPAAATCVGCNVDFCKTCATPTACDVCMVGYYKDATTNVCKPCTDVHA